MFQVGLDDAEFLADFGIDVTIEGRPARGIFDNAYADAFGLVAGTSPALIVFDTTPAAVGESVNIGDQQYKIVVIKPDGTGVKVLQLEEAYL